MVWLWKTMMLPMKTNELALKNGVLTDCVASDSWFTELLQMAIFSLVRKTPRWPFTSVLVNTRGDAKPTTVTGIHPGRLLMLRKRNLDDYDAQLLALEQGIIPRFVNYPGIYEFTCYLNIIQSWKMMVCSSWQALGQCAFLYDTPQLHPKRVCP